MIDKSLGQYQQLVKKGKGNRRPGYRGDNWGGPSYGGSSSRSSGGGNGSHDRGGGQHQAAAQRATPAPSPHRDDSAERAAQAAADALNAAREAEARETAREKAIQVAALTPKTIEPIRSAHVDTPTQIAEQKEIDLYGYQDAKAKAPTTLIPNVPYDRQVVWTGSPHGEHETGLRPTIVSNKYSPTYYQDKFGTGDRGSGIMGTVKDKATQMAKDFATRKAMKALGLGALNPFLGVGSWLLDKFAPGTKAKFTNKFKYTGPKTDTQKEATKKLVSGDTRGGDGQQITGGENIISENIKKFTGITEEDKAELIKRRNTVQGILDQGSYQGKELTEQQRNSLLNYIEQISKFLVDPMEVAYGGRIDKPLTGRSRDI